MFDRAPLHLDASDRDASIRALFTTGANGLKKS